MAKVESRQGLRTYDMGGGGEYKRKYGGREIEVPWFGKSKYPWIRYLRDMAQRSHKVRQQSLGRFNRLLAMDLDKARSRAKSEYVSHFNKESNHECPAARPESASKEMRTIQSVPLPCRRGSGGRAESVNRQTLLLGGGAFGFSLHRSQRDAK